MHGLEKPSATRRSAGAAWVGWVIVVSTIVIAVICAKVHESSARTAALQSIKDAGDAEVSFDDEGKLELQAAMWDVNTAVQTGSTSDILAATEFLRKRVANLPRQTPRLSRPLWLVGVDGRYTGFGLVNVDPIDPPTWKLTYVEPKDTELVIERGVEHYRVAWSEGPLTTMPRVWEAQRKHGVPISE